MGLNKVDDYFLKDTDLQNYTKTGVKRIIKVSKVAKIRNRYNQVLINPFIFQNNFQFSPLHFRKKHAFRIFLRLSPMSL